MLESIFSTLPAEVTITEILISAGASVLFGIIIALIHMYKNSYSKNFVVTLALLPVMVQLVIMLVNGNLGAGVAVMGAFSLIRFRSVPGNARDISSIFLSMGVGLATGMGYIGVAAIFVALVALLNLVFFSSSFGERNGSVKELKITIPESLDFESVFDDIFDKYAASRELIRVKTTNMGSLFELHYSIALKNEAFQKKMIDEIRCRNGNLNISCGRPSSLKEEL